MWWPKILYEINLHSTIQVDKIAEAFSRFEWSHLELSDLHLETHSRRRISRTPFDRWLRHLKAQLQPTICWLKGVHVIQGFHLLGPTETSSWNVRACGKID